jgi:macrolide-specific efflux system membrane fusion protein
MRKKKMWLYISLGIVFVAVSSVLYIKSHPGAPSPGTNVALGNTIQFKAANADLSSHVEVKGKSSYAQESIIYAPFSADVALWSANDGASVNKNDPLFKLDDKQIRNDIDLQTATIRRQELENKLKSAEQVSAAKVTNTLASNESEALQHHAQQASKEVQAELERLNRSLAATELEKKRALLDKADQRAPTAGILLLKDGIQPQTVREGEALGRIVDVSKLQMTTSVGEYDVFRIQPGMAAEVTIDALKQTKLTGKVEKVSKFPKAAGNATGTTQFEIVISLDTHDQLIAGLSLTASIQIETKKNVLTVPTLAVQRDKDSYYVMLETEQGIQKRNIKVGLETADQTEVLEGLQGGDTVVLQ